MKSIVDKILLNHARFYGMLQIQINSGEDPTTDPIESCKIVQDPRQNAVESSSILNKMLRDLCQDTEGLNSIL